MRNLFLSASLLAAAGASASVIDLRNLGTEFDQSSWGEGGTYQYATSVIADDVFLADFSYRINSGLPIDFQMHVTGTRADGGGGLGQSPNFADIRWSSGLLQHNGSGLLEFFGNANIGVNNGEKLWLVLDGATYAPGNSGSVRATGFGQGDYYPNNEFVYNNNLFGTLTDYDNTNWDHRDAFQEDLAIYANFTVPGPSAAGLLGLAGLAAARRRRA